MASGSGAEIDIAKDLPSGSNRADLNDAIGAFLYDENEHKRSTSTRNQKLSKEEYADQRAFYTNLHESMKLDASVNIDDLEGNLFSSLSLKQKKTVFTKPATSVIQGNIGTEENSAEFTQNESKHFTSKPASSVKPALNNDDLLDLLGGQDEEEIMPSRKGKPKFTLNSKRTGQSSISLEAFGSGLQVSEQLSTSSGLNKLSDISSTKDEAMSSEYVTLVQGADKKDECDMELSDEVTTLDTNALPMEIISEEELKKGSRFDELLGVNTSFQTTRRSKNHEIMGPSVDADKTVIPLDPNKEQEYQFGDYLPSAISKLDPYKSRSLQNTVPSGKKSVKFTETVKTDDRAPRPLATISDKLQNLSIMKSIGLVGDRNMEKSMVSDNAGLEKSIVQASPGQAVKSVKADERSQKELDPMSKLHNPLKHPFFPWQDTTYCSVTKEQKYSTSHSILAADEKPITKHELASSITAHSGDEVVEPQGNSLESWKQSSNIAPYEKKHEGLEELKTANEERELYKTRVVELEDRLKASEENKLRTTEELKLKLCALEDDRRSMLDKLDDLSTKLHIVTMERDKLQISLDNFTRRHHEEMESIKKEHGVRLHDVEESFQLRLARLQDDVELERKTLNEKLVALTKENTRHEVFLKKEIESLEIMKSNEVSSVKEMCEVLVENLKKEHELNLQHCSSLHRQEIEALKCSYSHSRTLSELTQQVEASVKEVAQIHTIIDQAHSKGLDQREQVIRFQQEHLNEMEGRLVKQQFSNDQEREKLQGLIAKLEAHVYQQSQQIEHEHWQIQQAAVKLRAQEVAFEEERSRTFKCFAEEKEKLQKAKETFLAEQQCILSQSYEEKRRLAAERTEFGNIQRMAAEKEKIEAERYLMAKADLLSKMAHLKDENSRIYDESAQLNQQQEKLRVELEAVKNEKEQLINISEILRLKLKEMEETRKIAQAAKEYGEKCLKDAQKYDNELVKQAHILHLQTHELQRREQELSKERIAFVRERRELPPVHHSKDEYSSSALLSTSVSSIEQQPIIGQDRLQCYQYKSIKQYIDQLNDSKCARQVAQHTQEDSEELEQEEDFLYSHTLLSDL